MASATIVEPNRAWVAAISEVNPARVCRPYDGAASRTRRSRRAVAPVQDTGLAGAAWRGEHVHG